MYIGLTTNEQWAGERSDEETIKIILERTGPSGANKDYLYNLCKAMRDIDPTDEYLYDLESKVAKAEKDRTEIKTSDD